MLPYQTGGHFASRRQASASDRLCANQVDDFTHATHLVEEECAAEIVAQRAITERYGVPDDGTDAALVEHITAYAEAARKARAIWVQAMDAYGADERARRRAAQEAAATRIAALGGADAAMLAAAALSSDYRPLAI